MFSVSWNWKNLWNLVNEMNKNLISSYGACGDINRNTVASPLSDIRNDYNYDSQKLAHEIDRATLAKSTGYYQIWVDGEKATTEENLAKLERIICMENLICQGNLK